MDVGDEEQGRECQRCSDVDEWSEKSFRSRESVGDEVQASDQESDAENNEKRAEMFSHLGNQFQRACQGNSELKKELKAILETLEQLWIDWNESERENSRLENRIKILEEELKSTKYKSFQDRSELSEYIDQLLEKIKDKESSLREADDDTTSMRIALERHYEHIVQKLRKQTANLKEEKRCLKKELDKISQERTSSTEEEITSKWKEITKKMEFEITRLQKGNKDLNQTVSKLRAENAQLLSECQSLSQRSSESAAASATLPSHCDSLSSADVNSFFTKIS